MTDASRRVDRPPRRPHHSPMTPLRPCPSCCRHVRVASASCPFCDAALEAVAATVLVAPAGLGRAALLAFGAAATAAASLAACGTGSAPPFGDASASESGSEAGPNDSAIPDTGTIAKPYGAPPADGLFELV